MNQLLSLEERIKLRDELIEEFKKLKIMYITSKNIYRILRSKLINKLNNNILLKEKYNKYISNFSCEQEALYCLIHQDDFENHKCPICQKIQSFHITNRRCEYHQTCGSKECKKKLIGSDKAKIKRDKTKENLYGNKNFNNRNKAQKTCERNYGAKNPFQIEKFKEKGKHANLEKLGVEYASQSEEIKDKIKVIKLQRYGNKNYNNLEKIKQSKLKRYGNINYNNSLKIKQTCNDRYNVDNPFQYEPFKRKIKERNLRERGYEYSSQSEEVKDKIKKTLMVKKGIQYYSNIDEINKFLQKYNNLFKYNINIYDIYNINEYFIIFIKKLNKYKKRLIKIKELCNIFGFTGQCIVKKLTQLKLLSYCYIQDSKLELKFKHFLESKGLIQIYNINNNISGFIRKEKSILPININTCGHSELDFYLKDYNIAFEINDVEGHNIKKKHQFYHLNKTIQCKQKGIRLIHLWEWEINDNDRWDKISKWILNLLDNSKIHINTNYNIQLVNIDEQKDFLNQYHLESYKQSDICLGLYHNNELLQIMSFIQNNNNLYELSRMCTKYGYDINYKYLLDYFISNYSPKYIITYCNLDKFTGKTYEELGFKLIQYNLPIPIYNKNQSSNYKKVYNCGQNVYVLK